MIANSLDLHIPSNAPRPPSFPSSLPPYSKVIEIREFYSAFDVHLLFLLPRHICTAAKESKNRKGSALVASKWMAIVGLGGGGGVSFMRARTACLHGAR